MYNIAGGSHSQIRHLRDKHNLDANGPIQKKRRLTFNGDTSTAAPIEQALVNQRISDFSPERFKTALLRWMAYVNISFRQVELPQFHKLLQEAYAEIGTAGCLPTAHTLVSWIKRDFHHYKAVVVEQLQEVKGHIHFTFDLWTAGNLLSLNEVFAHFLDPIGKKKKILLSILSINGSHTGEAIADGVGEIIKEFGLEERVGYFVLDNAGNNNTGVETLGRMFGFNPSKRRLRCTAHIVNLVATQIMYCKDLRLSRPRVMLLAPSRTTSSFGGARVP
ncbi:putative AC9 transposase [Fusarium oxysporum f. sp. conglutinans]|nr:putative AC9 transposase [Fusarium oxysporum f. sp. conglutinans]